MKLSADSITEQVIAGVIIAAIVAVPGVLWWAWHKFDVTARIRRQVEVAKVSEQQTADEQVAVMRKQVVETARELGIVIPISVRGSRPQIVTFSDGRVSYYYGDIPTLKRLLGNPPKTDPTRSFGGPNPYRPVSRWGREDLEDWLREHAN
ncbi:hypothetical protein [Nocardioides sp.]|uniref:hypothetical protein n=1 Tax=Nocardioides sp. TaxID=35761 RepID=UPI002D1B309E|nr:hypothetical protein [Nocardioides sp.]HSX68442.1 hypothetical protein [Nocardioides sp.]